MTGRLARLLTLGGKIRTNYLALVSVIGYTCLGPSRERGPTFRRTLSPDDHIGKLSWFGPDHVKGLVPRERWLIILRTLEARLSRPANLGCLEDKIEARLRRAIEKNEPKSPVIGWARIVADCDVDIIN
jgi:hypothetical protein